MTRSHPVAGDIHMMLSTIWSRDFRGSETVVAKHPHPAAIGFGITGQGDVIIFQGRIRTKHVYPVIADLLEAVIDQPVAVTRIARIVLPDPEPVPVFGALAGGDPAPHPGFIQIGDQGDVLDGVAFEHRLGRINSNAEVVGAIDGVVGKEHVIPAAKAVDTIGWIPKPAPQIDSDCIHVFDGHVLNRDVMIDSAIHAPGVPMP